MPTHCDAFEDCHNPFRVVRQGEATGQLDLDLIRAEDCGVLTA